MATTRQNPIEADVIGRAMGEAIKQAFDGVPKRAGLALGCTEHRGRAFARGDPSNPLFRVAQLIRKAPNTMVIISSLLSVAAMAMTRGLTDAELAHEYVLAREAETKFQGLCDVKETEWQRTGDTEAVFSATLHHVSASLRRMCFGLACQARDVDPRSAL